MGGVPVTLAYFAIILASVAQLAVAIVSAGLAWSFSRAMTVVGNMIEAHDNMRQAFDNMMAAFTHQEKAADNLAEWVVPPDQWAEVIELQKTFQGLGSEVRDYVIYCAKHGAYWAKSDNGYAKHVVDAKRFSAYEGSLIVLDRARNGDPIDCYTLVAVGKPE